MKKDVMIVTGAGQIGMAIARRVGFGKKIILGDKSLKNAINEFKKRYVKAILEQNDWNQTKSAKVLGIQRTYVSKLLTELEIKKQM